jgi:hypothetical protein
VLAIVAVSFRWPALGLLPFLSPYIGWWLLTFFSSAGYEITLAVPLVIALGVTSVETCWMARNAPRVPCKNGLACYTGVTALLFALLGWR